MDIATARAYLEMAYFFSGIIIACFAVVGVLQLRTLKYDIRTRSKRSSMELAFRLIERGHNVLIPEHSKWVTSVIANDIPTFDLGLEVELADTVQIQIDRARLLHLGENAEIVLTVLNEIEYIAVAVLSGACDEDLVFNAIGPSCCQIFVSMYDFVLALSKEDPDLMFNNATKLVNRWRKRVLQTRLLRKKTQIAAALENTSTKPIPKVGENP